LAERTSAEEEHDLKLNDELHHDYGPSLRRDEFEALLIYSMSVSVDGFIADREGGFGWTVPDEELFRFHLARVRELGCHLCGRELYETMLVWETDPSLRDTELDAAFADVWCALPKVVFSRTLDSVQGNARLAATAIKLGLVDELRMFRNPIVVGGGTPFLPPVTEDVLLELIETRTSGSRVIYERYRRIRGDMD
jgi:dihydrofolate reductase